MKLLIPFQQIEIKSKRAKTIGRQQLIEKYMESLREKEQLIKQFQNDHNEIQKRLCMLKKEPSKSKSSKHSSLSENSLNNYTCLPFTEESLKSSDIWNPDVFGDKFTFEDSAGMDAVEMSDLSSGLNNSSALQQGINVFKESKVNRSMQEDKEIFYLSKKTESEMGDEEGRATKQMNLMVRTVPLGGGFNDIQKLAEMAMKKKREKKMKEEQQKKQKNFDEYSFKHCSKTSKMSNTTSQEIQTSGVLFFESAKENANSDSMMKEVMTLQKNLTESNSIFDSKSANQEPHMDPVKEVINTCSRETFETKKHNQEKKSDHKLQFDNFSFDDKKPSNVTPKKNETPLVDLVNKQSSPLPSQGFKAITEGDITSTLTSKASFNKPQLPKIIEKEPSTETKSKKMLDIKNKKNKALSMNLLVTNLQSTSESRASTFNKKVESTAQGAVEQENIWDELCWVNINPQKKDPCKNNKENANVLAKGKQPTVIIMKHGNQRRKKVSSKKPNKVDLNKLKKELTYLPSDRASMCIEGEYQVSRSQKKGKRNLVTPLKTHLIEKDRLRKEDDFGVDTKQIISKGSFKKDSQDIDMNMRLSLPANDSDERKPAYPDGLITTNRSINSYNSSENGIKQSSIFETNESDYSRTGDNTDKSRTKKSLVATSDNELQEKAKHLNLLEEKPSPERDINTKLEEQSSNLTRSKDTELSLSIQTNSNFQKKLHEAPKLSNPDKERVPIGGEEEFETFFVGRKSQDGRYEEVIQEKKVVKTYFANSNLKKTMSLDEKDVEGGSQ